MWTERQRLPENRGKSVPICVRRTVALIDYGAGNVRSVHKALEAVGAEVRIVRDGAEMAGAEKIVLPGVGAFGDCMDALRRARLVEALRRAVAEGVPLLGICVGMQVLFEEGEEMGRHEGLGLLPGRVVRFPDALRVQGLKVPHTGWNQVWRTREDPLLESVPDGAWVYFNHSYFPETDFSCALAVTEYGVRFPSVVGRGRVYGIQFHPEKSQRVGLQILRNFLEVERCVRDLASPGRFCCVS